MKLDAVLDTAKQTARTVARGILWLTVPVVKSARGALDRDDVRHALVKAVGAGGLTWGSFRAAMHDPTVMEAMLSIGVGLIACVEALITRHANGAAPVPIINNVNVNVDATPQQPPAQGPTDVPRA